MVLHHLTFCLITAKQGYGSGRQKSPKICHKSVTNFNYKVENDLIRKDFVIDHLLTNEEIMSQDLLKKVVKLTDLSLDYISFLTDSIGLKYK